jgi:uncharacterized protein (TIGR03437 family)
VNRASWICVFWLSCAGAWAQAPVVAAGGVVNGASFGLAPNTGVAPGSLVSVFGSNLATSMAAADSIPLSTTLGNVSVTIGGFSAHLSFVCHLCVSGTGDQLNIQVPWEVQGNTASLVVTSGSSSSPPANIQVVSFNPGIFTVNSGTGSAIAFFTDGALAAPSGSIPGLSTRPAKSGDVLQILATGLGAVQSPPADGANSLDMLRHTLTTPTVLVGGMQAPPVQFSGLSPQFVGVYQVNVAVPQGVMTANAVALQIQIGGLTSTNQATIAVSD